MCVGGGAGEGMGRVRIRGCVKQGVGDIGIVEVGRGGARRLHDGSEWENWREHAP